MTLFVLEKAAGATEASPVTGRCADCGELERADEFEKHALRHGSTVVATAARKPR